ncbi:MAG: hypothetical protein LBR67_02965 [Dysgonamonadaceae bacterium]|nr:hypothetical protein [Dysgonamonadaceae bacterium]
MKRLTNPSVQYICISTRNCLPVLSRQRTSTIELRFWMASVGTISDGR